MWLGDRICNRRHDQSVRAVDPVIQLRRVSQRQHRANKLKCGIGARVRRQVAQDLHSYFELEFHRAELIKLDPNSCDILPNVTFADCLQRYV